MKKVLVLAVVSVLGLGLAAFAASTTVDVDWNAWGGSVPAGITINFANGDDSNSTLWTDGNHYWGEFHGTDADDNPYGYGVDSGTFSTKAYVQGGGKIEFDVNRIDSKTSYGQAGQYTYSGVGTTDGDASIVTRTSTNYAAQKNCNYGWQSNNQYMAAGSSFFINHYIYDGDSEGARVSVWSGNGSATITSMSDGMGGSSFSLGRGCGCYDNANASGIGSGTFELYGGASNALSGNGWSSGGGTYLQQIIYTDGFNINNSYISGN